MSDDWRLRVDLHEGGFAHALTERLEASELEHELETSFEDRVVVSRDGGDVFAYAGTRQQAEQAEKLIRSLAAENGWHLEAVLERWHPTAEQWEDADAPLPDSDAERAEERAELMEDERQEAEQRGYPEYEVRVELPSHDDAVRFADRLRSEGLASVRRSNYVLVGAADEDSANSLADRLRGEAPAGSTVTAQGTLEAAYADRPPNPFAVLGGLGG
jgi:hypothetical protein